MLTTPDNGGYDVEWTSVKEVLEAIKKNCPEEWREAIQPDLDDFQWNLEESQSRHDSA